MRTPTSDSSAVAVASLPDALSMPLTVGLEVGAGVLAARTVMLLATNFVAPTLTCTGVAAIAARAVSTWVGDTLAASVTFATMEPLESCTERMSAAEMSLDLGHQVKTTVKHSPHAAQWARGACRETKQHDLVWINLAS